MLNFLSQIDALPMKNVQTYLLEASVPATKQKNSVHMIYFDNRLLLRTKLPFKIGYEYERHSHNKKGLKRSKTLKTNRILIES